MIRNYILNNGNCTGLVPVGVEEYIKKHKLYTEE